MCPKPPQGTGAHSSSTSGNVSSLPDNDQPGPSTAIPNPPAVEDHHVSDDTNGEIQDEDNGHMYSRRKRRPRSELILAYQCSVCGKRYTSSQTLYQHRRSSHKQPPVTGDEAVEVDNSSIHEESQHPSKHRRRLKSEIVRKFSCPVCGMMYGSQAAMYTHNKKKHASPQL